MVKKQKREDLPECPLASQGTRHCIASAPRPGLKPVPDFLRRHIHHGRPSTRRPPRAGAGRLHVLGRRAGARGLLRVRGGLPRAMARRRLDHQVRPHGRLAPSRSRRRHVRPAALGRPSRRGRCRLPLRDDDVVLLLQPRQVAGGGSGTSGAVTRRGVTSKAPSAVAADAASAWALAAASARAFADSSSCAALAAAALSSSASRASRAFHSVAA